MSLPLGSPMRNLTLRVAIFAKITTMHLEKLISWDDMRDHSYAVTPRKKKSARLNETEFYTEERHDVFARAQILELSESGEYLPVEVLQQTEVDPGAFQLHQGLQRRLRLSLTHSSGEALEWKDVADVRIGSVQLLDPRGKIPGLSSPTKEVGLSTILGPVLKSNADGTSTVTIVAQWDSSLHNSILLDRTTADKYRVQMCLRWKVISPRLSEPILFSMDIAAQIQPRATRGTRKLMQLWSGIKIVHASVGLYQLVIRPAVARRAGDLWRMNTLHRYVKGEEYLAGWTPRSVSLVRDFISSKRRRVRVAEVENAKGFLSSLPVTRNVTPSPSLQEQRQQQQQQQQPIGRIVGRVLGKESGGAVLGAQIEEPIATPIAEIPLLGTDDGGGGYVYVEDSPAGTPPEAAPQTDTPPAEIAEPESPEDPKIHVLRKFVSLWSSWKDPSEVCCDLVPDDREIHWSAQARANRSDRRFW